MLEVCALAFFQMFHLKQSNRGWVLTFDHMHKDVEGFSVVFIGQLIVFVSFCLVSLLPVVGHLFSVRTEIAHIFIC